MSVPGNFAAHSRCRSNPVGALGDLTFPAKAALEAVAAIDYKGTRLFS